MAGQLRRGTEAERTSTGITPASGELIHCTDSGAWYGGDGVTAGGNAMPVAIGQQAVEAPTADGALLFDGGTRRWVADALALADLGDVEPAGAADQQALAWDPAQSAYAPADPATLTPAGTRPILVSSASPDELLIYLPCDGPIGDSPSLSNKGSGGGTALWDYNVGESDSTDLSRESAGGSFGQALRTSKGAGSGAGGFVRVTTGQVYPTQPWTIKIRFKISFAELSTWYGWLFVTSGYHGPYFDDYADESTGYLRFWLNDEFGGDPLTDQLPFPIGSWTEYCATHDGTTLREFIDGQLLNSVAVPVFPLHMVGVDSSTEFHLAGTWDGFNSTFALDEFQFWSECLHTGNYTPATLPASSSFAPSPPEAGRVGQLWTAAPSNGLFFCTAAGPPATWERIAYVSDLPPP